MDATVVATIILGVFGLLITGFYSRHNKKIADEQLLKQLFTEFNQRYDKLNNYLVEIERNYSTLELLQIASLVGEKQEVEKENIRIELTQKVIDYFSLCAEEFYWYYHKKRIDPLIWKSWHAGMNYWFKIPTIRALWEKEVKANGKQSYYITDNVEFFVKL